MRGTLRRINIVLGLWLIDLPLAFFRGRVTAVADRYRIAALERALEQEKTVSGRLSQQLADANIHLAEAEAQIGVMKVSIDGMAVVVEQYEGQFRALTRTLAMKGQTANANGLPEIFDR